LFSGDIDEGIVIGHSSGASEIVERYRLPLFYLAATVGDDLQDLQFTSFHPAETSGDIAYYLEWMWNHARDRRNPLLDSDDVKKRRRTIKAMLKIP
jgi:hypothetical protein